MLAFGDEAHVGVLFLPFGVFDQDVFEHGELFAPFLEELHFSERAGPYRCESVVVGVGASGADGEEQSGITVVAVHGAVFAVCGKRGIVLADPAVLEAHSLVLDVCYQHVEVEWRRGSGSSDLPYLEFVCAFVVLDGPWWCVGAVFQAV